VALVALLAGAACGDGQNERAAGGARPAARVTLVLDFTPNAVHAGIFRALPAGYYAAEGVDLRIVEPSATADALKLVGAGEADVGLADAIDVARGVDRGRPARAIMGIVQRPLGGVLTVQTTRITSPVQLENRTVGVTGVPSDDAVLDTVVRAVGGNPARVKRVTLGFGGLSALRSGRVDAITAFWPADAASVRAAGGAPRVFRLDDHGGPRYPGLVAFASPQRLRAEAARLRGFVRATVRGYRDVVRDPALGLRDLLARNRGLSRAVSTAQLAAYRPLFGDPATVGALPRERLRALSEFLVRTRLVRRPVPAERLATEALLP